MNVGHGSCCSFCDALDGFRYVMEGAQKVDTEHWELHCLTRSQNTNSRYTVAPQSWLSAFLRNASMSNKSRVSTTTKTTNQANFMVT